MKDDKKEKSSKKELGGKSVFALVAQVLSQFLSMLYVAMAGNLVGKSTYGTFVYILSIFTVIVSFTRFGFSNSLVAYTSREDISIEKKRWIISYAMKLSMALCVLVTIVFVLMGDNITVVFGKVEMDKTLFFITVPFLFFKTAIELMSAVLRGKKDMKGYFTGYLLLGNVIRVVALPIAVFVFGVRDVYSMVVIYYISFIANIIYCLYHIKKAGFIGGIKEVFPWKDLLAYSVPLVFTGMVHVLNKEIDSYMIGLCIDSGQVAIYNVAANVGLFSSFTLTAVNSIFAPMISELYHNGKLEELQSLYTLSTKWIIVVNILIVGIVLIFPDDIMRIAGKEFAEGGLVLVIVIVGQLINCMVGSVGFLNSMTGHAVSNMISNICALAVNILLNVLLIEKLGVVGAGIATAASVAVNNFMNFFFMHRNLKLVPYTRQFLRIPVVLAICIPVLMGMKLLMAPLFFLVRLGIAAVIYGIIYVALTYLIVCDKEEKKLVSKKLKKITNKYLKKNTDK